MRHRRTSVVLATGGSAMVRTAYSSGKPTLAVGPGNVPVYVHPSMRHPTGRGGRPDSHLQGLRLRHRLRRRAGSRGRSGGRRPAAGRSPIRSVATSAARARPIDWAPSSSTSGAISAPTRWESRPAGLAELAGFDVPPRTRVFCSRSRPRLAATDRSRAEKLDPVLAWYEAADPEEGYQVCRAGAPLRRPRSHARHSSPTTPTSFRRSPACRPAVLWSTSHR